MSFETVPIYFIEETQSVNIFQNYDMTIITTCQNDRYSFVLFGKSIKADAVDIQCDNEKSSLKQR